MYTGIDIGGTKCAVVLGDENANIIDKNFRKPLEQMKRTLFEKYYITVCYTSRPPNFSFIRIFGACSRNAAIHPLKNRTAATRQSYILM